MAWSSFLLCGGSEPHPAVRAHPGMDWTFCFGCDEDVQSHRTLRRVQNLFTETDELRGSRETAQRTSSDKFCQAGRYRTEEELNENTEPAALCLKETPADWTLLFCHITSQ